MAIVWHHWEKSEAEPCLNIDGTQHILVAYLQLVLKYISRFYVRQLSLQTKSSSDLLTRFENLLRSYYDEGRQQTYGLPTVKYCAQELFLSTNYFGESPTQYLRHKRK